jgi:hypothetical protein
VSNDAVNLYVTYSTAGGWKLKATQLFAGVCANLPKGKTGNPTIGLFPHKETFNSFTESWKCTIPLSSLPSCFCLAAHAELVKVENGNVVQSETGWGEGTLITPKGSWAMSFNYCVQPCGNTTTTTNTEGCSMSQGYWFSKPGVKWPGTIVIGGNSYTQEEGKAIWDSPNNGGIPDSKAGFTQVAAIKLSGSTVKPTATVWADVAIVEKYLSTIGKLHPGNLPSGNDAAKQAAGRIGNWINGNHCP